MDKELSGMLQKFSAEHYPQWKFQLKCALNAKGLGKYIEDGASGFLDTSAGAGGMGESAAGAVLRQREDAAAMFIITSSLTYEQMIIIENCTSARQMIDKFDATYAQKSEFNKMSLHERFYQYKMNEKDSIAQHIAKIESLAKQIRESGDQMSDTAIITKIISSLPNKYRNVRQAWLSMDASRQTIANLTVRLLDEEASLSENYDYADPIALATATKHDYTERRNNGMAPICFYCYRIGHIAKNCFSRKRNSGKSEPGASNMTYEYTALSVKTSAEHFESKDKDTWFLDSGASEHMTSRLDFFKTLSNCEIKSVHLGDDTELIVKGVGTVYIKKWLNNQWCDSEINNVLYVPSLKKNLLSEGALTEKGYSIYKEKGYANIMNMYKRLVAHAQRQPNNLYRLLFKTAMFRNNLTVNINSVTAANRLECKKMLQNEFSVHSFCEPQEQNQYAFDLKIKKGQNACSSETTQCFKEEDKECIVQGIYMVTDSMPGVLHHAEYPVHCENDGVKSIIHALNRIPIMQASILTSHGDGISYKSSVNDTVQTHQEESSGQNTLGDDCVLKEIFFDCKGTPLKVNFTPQYLDMYKETYSDRERVIGYFNYFSPISRYRDDYARSKP